MMQIYPFELCYMIKDLFLQGQIYKNSNIKILERQQMLSKLELHILY